MGELRTTQSTCPVCGQTADHNIIIVGTFRKLTIRTCPNLAAGEIRVVKRD